MLEESFGSSAALLVSFCFFVFYFVWHRQERYEPRRPSAFYFRDFRRGFGVGIQNDGGKGWLVECPSECGMGWWNTGMLGLSLRFGADWAIPCWDVPRYFTVFFFFVFVFCFFLIFSFVSSTIPWFLSNFRLRILFLDSVRAVECSGAVLLFLLSDVQ